MEDFVGKSEEFGLYPVESGGSLEDFRQEMT